MTSDELKSILQRYRDRMKKISDRDRQMTTALAAIHTSTIAANNAFELAVRGKKLSREKMNLLEELIKEGQKAQYDDEDETTDGS